MYELWQNGSFWSNVVFEKEVIFHQYTCVWIWFPDLRIACWGPEIQHLKAHNFVWQWCFFFHYYLAILTTNWGQIFTGLLFCAYVKIEKNCLWQLFDQRCLVSYRGLFEIKVLLMYNKQYVLEGYSLKDFL